MNASATAAPPPFEEHYLAAHHGLREALSGLLLSVGADPDAPQEVARRFGLNRGLTWKVCKVIRSDDAFGAFPQVPGRAAIRTLLDAFERDGAEREAIEAVVRAADAFDRMVAVHAGDRATLELMLDSLAPSGIQSEPLEVSRKLAFRGNSGIWGLQAKARVRTLLIAPSKDDPTQLDLGSISGFVRLKRFRRDAVAPLFQRRTSYDEPGRRAPEHLPLLPEPAGREGSRLLGDYCSKPLPEVRVVRIGDVEQYQIAEGAIGDLGTTTAIHGHVLRRFAPRFRDADNARGEIITDVNAPVETLLVDVVAHRDLHDWMQLEAHLFHGSNSTPLEREGRELPCFEEVRELAGSPPHVTTPLVPRYAELVNTSLEAMGWRPEEFRGRRFELRFPPTPSFVVLSFPLPERE